MLLVMGCCMPGCCMLEQLLENLQQEGSKSIT